MWQGIANENAAGIHRICERSDHPEKMMKKNVLISLAVI